MSRITLLA